MIQILGIIHHYQDLMMISVWKPFLVWNISKPCPSLVCYYHLYKVPEDKLKVFLKEYRSSPELYYPVYMKLLWFYFIWESYFWILLKKLWQEVLFLLLMSLWIPMKYQAILVPSPLNKLPLSLFVYLYITGFQDPQAYSYPYGRVLIPVHRQGGS